jgi:hypothetical protein
MNFEDQYKFSYVSKIPALRNLSDQIGKENFMDSLEMPQRKQGFEIRKQKTRMCPNEISLHFWRMCENRARFPSTLSPSKSSGTRRAKQK